MIIYFESFCAHFLGSSNKREYVKWIKLFLYLMWFYLYFIFIKIISWLHFYLNDFDP